MFDKINILEHFRSKGAATEPVRSGLRDTRKHVRLGWLLSVRTQPRPRPGCVHVPVVGGPGKRVRQGVRGRGPAAGRDRPGPGGHHLRGPAEDDQPELLLRPALSQEPDGVPAQPQAGGSCFWVSTLNEAGIQPKQRFDICI